MIVVAFILQITACVVWIFVNAINGDREQMGAWIGLLISVVGMGLYALGVF